MYSICSKEWSKIIHDMDEFITAVVHVTMLQEFLLALNVVNRYQFCDTFYLNFGHLLPEGVIEGFRAEQHLMSSQIGEDVDQRWKPVQKSRSGVDVVKQSSDDGTVPLLH